MTSIYPVSTGIRPAPRFGVGKPNIPQNRTVPQNGLRHVWQQRSLFPPRFGEIKRTFDSLDIAKLTPELLEAFVQRFSPGQTILLEKEDKITPCLVRSNTVGELCVEEPDTGKTLILRGLKENELLWKQMFHLNLPVLNGVKTVDEAWRDSDMEKWELYEEPNHFTAQDAIKLNPAMVNAFFKRFDPKTSPGVRLLYAPSPKDPILQWEVLDHNGYNRIKLKNPANGEAITLNYLSDNNADDMKVLLAVSRPLINNPNIGPATAWRHMFETLINRKVYQRPADSTDPGLRRLTPAKVLANDLAVFHPIGFTLKNQLIMVQNPNWPDKPEPLVGLSPITGFAFLEGPRVRALAPKTEAAKNRLPADKCFYVLNVPTESVYPVRPWEGLYENDAFVIHIPGLTDTND